MDACIDAAIESMLNTLFYSYHLPCVVYAHSAQVSAHRKFAVDVFTNCWTRKDWSLDIKGCPKEFLSHIIKEASLRFEAGAKVQSGSKYFDLNDTCKWHDHGSEKPCYKEKPAFRS
jgi:hypothetical protein